MSKLNRQQQEKKREEKSEFVDGTIGGCLSLAGVDYARKKNSCLQGRLRSVCYDQCLNSIVRIQFLLALSVHIYVFFSILIRCA